MELISPAGLPRGNGSGLSPGISVPPRPLPVRGPEHSLFSLEFWSSAVGYVVQSWVLLHATKSWRRFTFI